MIEAYGLSAIYLATDDPETVIQARSDAQALFGLQGDAIFHLKFERKMYMSGYYNNALSRGQINATADAMAVMTDLLLLAACDSFVGKFTSNLARIAYALSSAHRGGACLVPWHSLDATWCADFGKPSGMSLNETAFMC